LTYPDNAPPLSPNQRGGHTWKFWVPVGCLILLLAVMLFAGGILMLVFGSMRSSDVYKMAVRRAQADTRVTQALGTPVEGGWFITGNISVHGSSGEADLAIPLKGSIDEGTLYVIASKSAGEWQFSKLQLEVNSSHDRFCLLVPLPPAQTR